MKLYIENLRKYNEGESVGEWIELPQKPENLNTFLHEKIGINREYPEYAIHDFEAPFPIDEYSNIHDLNLLAGSLKNLSQDEKNAVLLYCENQGIYDPVEMTNVCMQANEIPYNFYNFEGIQNCADMDKEEKFGYTLATENGLLEKLEEMNITFYFNFKDYGRDCCINNNILLTDNGYITESYIDTEHYSKQELQKEIFGNLEPEQNISHDEDMDI